MFNNIGGKIKGLAIIICWLGIIASVIAGIVTMTSSRYTGESLVIPGILIIGLGSLLSWIGSFFTYGFGELIDNTSEIQETLDGMAYRANKREREASGITYEIPSQPILNAGQEWKCKKCGEQNKRNDVFCKNCGTYK